ncbi:MAG: hypothetical protein FWG85_07545 [Bacteroidetes bacterium]|nr:hypothetical protein [Bacteroidota bacterium]
MKKHLILLTLILATQNANSQFGSGNGTSASPYQITTRQHLEALATNVNGGNPYTGIHFKLMNNITDGVRSVIGNSIRAFQGVFDGQGYAITLAINRVREDNVGLFGRVFNATIKNVSVNGNVIGRDYVGGITGSAPGPYSSIVNCINTGNISGNSFVGGITGGGTQIINCINTGNIIGVDFVGGIAGGGFSKQITNCMNLGDISGKGHIGGVIGCDNNSDVVITYCVNYGFVKGKDTGVGGINGHYYHTIRNCINTAVVEGEDASVTGPIQGSP